MKFTCQLLVLLFIFLFTSFTVSAQSKATASVSDAIFLWPNSQKDSVSGEKNMTRPSDNIVAGKAVIRLGNISAPTITVYKPRKKSSDAAVVVCPGGGYSILAIDLEGSEICHWFNSLGITAVLLKYRVPAKPGGLRYAAPLEDVQRALSLVRSNATRWKIDGNKVGVLGFSAGGHLSALASTNYRSRSYARKDDVDTVSCRPDFVMLIYPAYLVERGNNRQVSAELPITADTPPTFLMQTEDDPVGVEGSLTYYLALKQAKVPAEMHLYATGGHGYGLRNTDRNYTSWPKRAEEWLREIRILKKK